VLLDLLGLNGFLLMDALERQEDFLLVLTFLKGFQLVLLQFLDAILYVGEVVLLLFEGLVCAEEVVAMQAAGGGLLFYGGAVDGVVL
jgi:hypothetical protein